MVEESGCGYRDSGPWPSAGRVGWEWGGRSSVAACADRARRHIRAGRAAFPLLRQAARSGWVIWLLVSRGRAAASMHKGRGPRGWHDDDNNSAAAEAARLPGRPRGGRMMTRCRGGAARAPPQPRHCRRCVRAPDAVVPRRGRLCPSARTRAYSTWARHTRLFAQHAVDAPAAPDGGTASRARVRLAAPPLDSDRFFAVLKPWLGHFAICSALAHATLIN